MSHSDVPLPVHVVASTERRCGCRGSLGHPSHPGSLGGSDWSPLVRAARLPLHVSRHQAPGGHKYVPEKLQALEVGDAREAVKMVFVFVPAARSPVFSHLSSSLQGLETIRALRAEQRFQKAFDAHQDLHSG